MKHRGWLGFVEREARNAWNKYVHSDVASWRKVYTQRYCDKLESTDQRSRHYLIAGAVRELLPKSAKILDVGCGCGTTLRMLADYPRYHGIDMTPEAIDACLRAFPDRSNAFEIADFETYDLGKCDAVVFNEVLYYFPLRKVPELLNRTVASLRDDNSLLIVSMSKTLKSHILWRQLDSLGWPIQDTSLAGRAIGGRWNVKVYRPFAEPSVIPNWYRNLSTALLLDTWRGPSMG
jgi:SAM-dependent methyltransferase